MWSSRRCRRCTSFPALPQPLRWVAGADARRHDRALAALGARRGGDVSHVDIELELNRGVMAADGFHPGEPVYRQCATMIARHIAADVWPTLPGDTPMTTRNLQGKTLFITGASRGIGLAIAVRAAADGANIVLIAKTTEPNPKLPGTLASAAEAVEAAGGQALAVPDRHPRRGGRGRGGEGGGGALRRHRHPGQQRQRDQPDADAGHADEALRPDVRRQRARHLLLHPGLPARR